VGLGYVHLGRAARPQRWMKRSASAGDGTAKKPTDAPSTFSMSRRHLLHFGGYSQAARSALNFVTLVTPLIAQPLEVIKCADWVLVSARKWLRRWTNRGAGPPEKIAEVPKVHTGPICSGCYDAPPACLSSFFIATGPRSRRSGRLREARSGARRAIPQVAVQKLRTLLRPPICRRRSNARQL